MLCSGIVVVVTIVIAFGCGPPATSRLVGPRATTTLPASLPPAPPARGEWELATSTRGHSYLERHGDHGTRADPSSAYTTLASTEGVIGYRASRFFGIRALGSLGIGAGAVDAYDLDTVAPSWPTRLGVGVVVGFASDVEPFQIQLTVDAGIVGLANSQRLHLQTRECPPNARWDWDCTAWQRASVDEFSVGISVRPYLRASLVAGGELTPWLRVLAQAGVVYQTLPDQHGAHDYNLVVAFDANVEWLLDPNTSLFASGGWAALDPFFTHGPSFSLGIRVVLPSTGPGSVRREQEARVRQIARRWNLVAPPPLVLTPHLAPHSMLRSRVPVPDWMLDILGASIEMTVGPADAEPSETPPE